MDPIGHEIRRKESEWRSNMETIGVKELMDRIESKKGELLLFDARGDEAFKKGHIPHAKSVPETALRERVEDLVDKDREILVYSKDEDCPKSTNAARQLEQMGYRKVKRVPAGIEGWKEAGHETVAG
jgi:rhodanese-related sulfurtransferase